MVNNIAVIGASGAIGHALTRQLSELHPGADIFAFSRTRPKQPVQNVTYQLIDYDDEGSIQAAAAMASKVKPLDMIIVAIGILHDGDLMPEKSLKEISADKFQHLFQANTIVPALVAKHFLPKINKNNRAVFAALSARVGSISDNRLGGWYAYRASKAALNMVIKNAAIEIGRRYKQAVVVGVHPGTVDSDLSKPFQSNVPDGKLFSPKFSAGKILEVLGDLTPNDSGRCFAWDGKEIEP